MSKPLEAAWQALDAELLAAEEELAREKRWIDQDSQDLLQGWVHDLIDMKDIGDYAA